MAIKGKKKKKAASSARRPPGAPRTIQSVARKEPWHARPGVRVAVGVAAAILLITVVLLVKRSGDEADRLAERQEAIETFTKDTQALFQRISPTAAEMGAATPKLKTLEADARRWDRTLTGVQEDLSSFVASAPPELDSANRLIFQSVLQYIAAAKTFALVPEAEGALANQIEERASAQVSAADGTWSGGIAVLDEVRIDAELSASGLPPPSAVPPPAPSPSGG